MEKPVTIGLLLTLAAQFNWFLNQLDVSNAFLNGHLTESDFVTQPPGFEDPTKPIHVCKLNKFLYGLKQAPRVWYEEAAQLCYFSWLHWLSICHSLFVKKGYAMVFILMYVDDILVTSPSIAAYQHVIQQLNELFPIKVLGPFHYFLGIEAKRSSSGIFISQTKYILDLLKKANMDG